MTICHGFLTSDNFMYHFPSTLDQTILKFNWLDWYHSTSCHSSIFWFGSHIFLDLIPGWCTHLKIRYVVIMVQVEIRWKSFIFKRSLAKYECSCLMLMLNGHKTRFNKEFKIQFAIKEVVFHLEAIMLILHSQTTFCRCSFLFLYCVIKAPCMLSF